MKVRGAPSPYTLALPEPLDQALVRLYRGWDALEQASESGRQIIDFDLADPAAFKPFRSRRAVLTAIGKLLKTLDAHPLQQSAKALVRRRLLASRAFLKALEGRELPFREYLSQTMGLEPLLIPEAELQAQRQVADSSLAHFHVGAVSLSLSLEHAHLFQQRFLIRDESKLTNHFAYYLTKWLPVLSQVLGSALPGYQIAVTPSGQASRTQLWEITSADAPHVRQPYTIQVSFASADAYWKNWISGNLGQGTIDLRINVHTRHTWFAGAPEILVLHEYCGHAVQMLMWRHRIIAGFLPQFAGILTVHFPDQYLLEGLAESLPYILPDFGGSLEKQTRALRDVQYYTLLVLNNAHVMASTKTGFGAALAYAKERLPFFGDDKLEHELKTRTTDTLFRVYQFVYLPAKRDFLRIRESLTRHDLLQVLGAAYSGPFLPDQFLRLAESIGRRGEDALL